MGHYYYINQVSEKDDFFEDIVEWKSEVPPMFFPLFSGKPSYKNNYLYASAEEGFKAFKQMFDFLDRHKAVAFKEPDEFVKYKNKIIEAVEPIGTHYLLNGEDVFAITVSRAKEFLEASKNCYRLMNEVNEQIKVAIEKDDIEAFLDIYTDNGITHATQSLRYFFNHEIYKFGYEPLSAYQFLPTEEELEVEIFEENGKKGLKNKNNTIILQPCYDEIWEFDEIAKLTIVKNQNKFGCINTKGEQVIPLIYDEIWEFEENSELAVVKNQNKFGYINKKGEEVIPLMYDDAYDFYFIDEDSHKTLEKPIGKYLAPVALNEKFGLINEKNQVIMSFEWDDTRVVNWDCSDFEHYLVFAKKENKYGVFDTNGKSIYPIEIEDYIVGYGELDDQSKTGFYECFWIKTSAETFYLNNQFEKYGYNLDIIQNGIFLGKSNGCFNYVFIAKDENGKMGLIHSKNKIIIPFEYDSLELTESLYKGVNINLYFAKNKQIARIYTVDKSEQASLILEEKIDRVAPFYSNEKDKFIELIHKKKKGLFDVIKKEWVLPMEYDDIFLCSTHKMSVLYTFREDVIEQYNPNTMAKEPFEIKHFENAIKEGNKYKLKKHTKEKFYSLKELYYDSQINAIFTNTQQREAALSYFSKVNFNDPQEIAEATKIVGTDDLTNYNILFDAFQYHYERNEKSASLDVQYALFHYHKALKYENMQNYNEAYILGKKAFNIIPEFNRDSFIIIEFVSRMAYFIDAFEESITFGNKGLAWIESVRENTKAGLRWDISNVKAYLENLNSIEETIHYYLANSHFEKPDLDYELAKYHIEISLKMSNWNEYSKKYIYACCMASTVVADQFLPILDEFITYAKDYDPGIELAYIKYTYAYYEFHTNKNKAKALQLIEESLAINPDDKTYKDLKKEINKKNGFFDFLK